MKKFYLLLLMMLAVAAHAAEPATQERLDEVAERGSRVMPFALERTLHVFDKTDTGGIQQVIAKDAADSQQIALIRQHLSGLASRFAQGDFSGPKRIHGDAMPGVAALSTAAAGKVRFVYQALADGGQIDYRSDEPELVATIHRFFDAQTSDHARHVKHHTN